MTNLRNQAYIKRFGDNLRVIRQEKGMSQGQLSILSDLPLSQIGRIERGEVNTTISTLLALADALELEPKTLLDFIYRRN